MRLKSEGVTRALSAILGTHLTILKLIHSFSTVYPSIETDYDMSLNLLRVFPEIMKPRKTRWYATGSCRVLRSLDEQPWSGLACHCTIPGSRAGEKERNHVRKERPKCIFTIVCSFVARDSDETDKQGD